MVKIEYCDSKDYCLKNLKKILTKTSLNANVFARYFGNLKLICTTCLT